MQKNFASGLLILNHILYFLPFCVKPELDLYPELPSNACSDRLLLLITVYCIKLKLKIGPRIMNISTYPVKLKCRRNLIAKIGNIVIPKKS